MTETHTHAVSPLPPPEPGSYMKLRNEIMAGGTDRDTGEEPTVGGSRAVLGIGIIVALLVALGLWSGWALLFVIGLLVCIFLHEMGHFVTARLTGMKATQFFLFMGPKLWSFKRGEVEYGVRAYPVGAFVRIIGMNNLDEVAPEDESRAYRNKSYPRRLLVITAGSVMHMVIALSLIIAVFAVDGRRVDTDQVGVSVAAGGPAQAAGLHDDDTILSIDGVMPTSAEQFVSIIHSHQPQDVVRIVVQRDGQPLTFDVGLGSNPNQGAAFGSAYLGVGSGVVTAWSQQSVASAIPDAFQEVGSVAWQSVTGVVKVLNPVTIWGHLSGTDDDPSTRPSTVVGISKATKSVGLEFGLAGVLLMLAYVNIFIGLFNMIPLLPFDGGHAAIATYERARSRRGHPYRADINKMVPVALMTMTLLGFMFITAFYLDIFKT